MAKDVKHDLIPYEAGVVIITPLDVNKKPDYTKAVATERDFLVSTQTTETRTTETLGNGNGADKDFPTDVKYTLAVVGNTYNYDFHRTVTGRVTGTAATAIIPTEFTHTLTGTTDIKIEFGTGKDVVTEPAADDSGKYNFIVSDAYGNVMEQVTSTEPTTGQYKYDSSSKTLMFATADSGTIVRVIYYISVTNPVITESNSTLSLPEFQVECFGITTSANDDSKYRVYTKLARATATGDITDQMTQKSKSAPITYNFASTPVPESVKAYTQVLSKIVTA